MSFYMLYCDKSKSKSKNFFLKILFEINKEKLGFKTNSENSWNLNSNYIEIVILIRVYYYLQI